MNMKMMEMLIAQIDSAESITRSMKITNLIGILRRNPQVYPKF
jgi:hypothetical protein